MSAWRHYLFLVSFISIACALSVRVVYLSVTERDFLQEEGDKRSIYGKRLPGMRGMIYDRNGEALAVSTPVFAVAVNPRQFDAQTSEKLTQLPMRWEWKSALRESLQRNRDRGYLYLKRHLSWERMDDIRRLRLPICS